MSMINGEKARAAVNRKKRNAQRVKDRARVAELKAQQAQAAPAAPAAKAKPAAKRKTAAKETGA